MMHFTAADWVVLGVYAAALFLSGFLARGKREMGAEDYILSGRKLTLPAFTATLVATWYGGILGVGEYSYLYGVSNWVVFGFPYYVFAVLFALVFARRVRESMALTIPDQLGKHYGGAVAVAGSVLVFFISSPAPYVFMQALLLQVLTGWPFLVCIAAGTTISILSLYGGGFRSVVRMDRVQFALMFGGFALMLAFLVPEKGLGIFFSGDFPRHALTLTGGRSWQYVLVWFFIALWTLVAPQFHQLTLSASSPTVARRGIMLSVLFWFIFDGMTTLTGLYARALLPGLERPAMAYPLLAEAVLPPVAKALFFVGMLATIMSTTDGLAFIAAAAIGRDILARLSSRSGGGDVRRFTRLGVLLTFAVSIAAAIVFPSVVQLWYVIGTLFIPALLLPLLSTYHERMRLAPSPTLVSMALGFSLSFCSFLWGAMHGEAGAPRYLFGIEPMYLGLAGSAFPYIARRFREREPKTLSKGGTTGA